MHVYIYIGAYIYVCMYVGLCMYVCMYVFMYVCMYVCTCIYACCMSCELDSSCHVCISNCVHIPVAKKHKNSNDYRRVFTLEKFRIYQSVLIIVRPNMFVTL